MRLWHIDLIQKLPRQQLLGQWRECIALLGNGWGKRHRTVNYVFKYPVETLVVYSFCVASEMFNRRYNANIELIEKAVKKRDKKISLELVKFYMNNKNLYEEHNDEYYKECIDNLKNKGVNI